MIVGVVSGIPAAQLVPWCASARNHYRGPMMLLTDTPAQYQELADTYGIDLWLSELRTPTEGVCGIARTRWKALADALADIEPQLPVVFADTRDVIFQSDPTLVVDGTLVIGTEAKRHKENRWCMAWLTYLLPAATVQELAELEVLNAGVIGGPAGLLRQFALDLTDEIPRIPCDCTSGAAHMTDQTVVNVLLRASTWGERVQIRSDWVYHVASTEGGVERIPAVICERSGETLLLRGDRKPFPMVHQYDLAEQLKGYANLR